MTNDDKLDHIFRMKVLFRVLGLWGSRSFHLAWGVTLNEKYDPTHIKGTYYR